MLQSWSWGAFKSRFGWDVERVMVPTPGGTALAQILFRTRFGVSIGYVPRGPALSGEAGDQEEFWAAIDRLARRHRAVAVIVEPDNERVAMQVDTGVRRLHSGPPHIQPARTVKVDLLEDESLLAQMHQKTRYNIRLAQRRGVATRKVQPNDEAMAVFYSLLRDTAQRNSFSTHEPAYYEAFLGEFGDNAVLLFAEIDGRPAAALIAAAFGDEAIYMYGASSTKDRAHGAGFLIQFEAMRWARDRGCRRYDLWGIPAVDPASTQVESGDRIAGTTGQDWRGLYEFKTRFGGKIVQYPPTRERRYLPLLASLARRYYSPGV
jgi:lipid II:glycine glycyltransferase (peptidoglycan interpeptide bridge formation enzyme)